ncbi:hypothetical protein [Marinomonas epiphytica]
MSRFRPSTRSNIAGFLLLEMLFCLALLALVLTQMASMHSQQWQSLKRDKDSRNQQEQAKVDATLARLLGGSALLRGAQSPVSEYPKCHFCQGQDFTLWYQRSKTLRTSQLQSDKGPSQ